MKKTKCVSNTNGKLVFVQFAVYVFCLRMPQLFIIGIKKIQNISQSTGNLQFVTNCIRMVIETD